MRLLIVRLPDEEFAAGLLIDAVDRIVAVNADAMAPPEALLDGPLATYVRGVCEIDGRPVAVLAFDRLLRSAEVRQFEDPQDVVTDED
jgi:purine-binding chemotaxis protein CheW